MFKSIENKCYKLVKETKTWFGAVDECLKRNSSLLSIQDQIEQGKIECTCSCFFKIILFSYKNASSVCIFMILK